MMEGTPGTPELTSGASFGKYRLVRKLGEGAFGTVYEALLPGPMGFTKRYAIKKIRSQLIEGDPRFVQSMVNEARIGGLLHHANIVDILEFDQVGKHWYIAMEFVDGADLAQVLHLCRQNKVLLPRFAIVDLMLQVCRGLHHAHNIKDHQGNPVDLIHRDLKPSNLIIDRDGIAKILDFGIAKAASNLFNTTSAGMAKGTPRYMSPEQITAEKSLTTASDIFSLGVVLFETITARTLFNADSLPALIHKIISADLTEQLDEAEAAFPGSRDLLTLALQRDPKKRIQDAKELAAGLRELGRAYPAEAEMSDVIGRLMPVVDRTDSVEIKDSADLDLESSTVNYHREDAKADASSEMAPITPAAPTSAGWDRFSMVMERVIRESMDPDAEDDDEVHEKPAMIGPRGATPTGWSDGSDPSASAGDGGLALPPRQNPSQAPMAEVGSLEDSMEATIAAAGADVSDQPDRSPPSRWQVYALAGLAGVLAIVLAIVLLPGLLGSDGTGGDEASGVDPRDGAVDAAGGTTEPGIPEEIETPAVEPTTSEPAVKLTPEPATPEPATPEPATPEPATPEPPTPAVVEPAPEVDPEPTYEYEPGTISMTVKPWAEFRLDGNVVVSQSNKMRPQPVDGGEHMVRVICHPEKKEKTWTVIVDGKNSNLGCWDFQTDGPCSF